jgi:hypothetical protein
MGIAARHTFGSRGAEIVVFLIVYGYSFLGNATYLQVLADSIRSVYCGTTSCESLSFFGSLILAVLFCAPFVCAVQRVSDSILLCFINTLALLIVLGIIFGATIAGGRSSNVESPLFPPSMNFKSFFGNSTNILYAYAGHWLYFELIDTMERPETFPLVFLVNAPLQGGLYIAAGLLSYVYFGLSASEDGLQHEMSDGILYRVSEGLLFFHVLVVFLIKSVVLVRFVVVSILPEAEAAPRAPRPLGLHIVCSVVMLALSVVVTSYVPCFTNFLGIIGGLFAAPISYLLPVMFYCGALGRFHEPSTDRPAAPPPNSLRQISGETQSVSLVGSSMMFQSQSFRTFRALSTTKLGEQICVPSFSCAKLRAALKWHQILVFLVIFLFCGPIACIGTYEQIEQLIDHLMGKD